MSDSPDKKPQIRDLFQLVPSSSDENIPADAEMLTRWNDVRYGVIISEKSKKHLPAREQGFKAKILQVGDVIASRQDASRWVYVVDITIKNTILIHDNALVFRPRANTPFRFPSWAFVILAKRQAHNWGGTMLLSLTNILNQKIEEVPAIVPAGEKALKSFIEIQYLRLEQAILEDQFFNSLAHRMMEGLPIKGTLSEAKAIRDAAKTNLQETQK